MKNWFIICLGVLITSGLPLISIAQSHQASKSFMGFTASRGVTIVPYRQTTMAGRYSADFFTITVSGPGNPGISVVESAPDDPSGKVPLAGNGISPHLVNITTNYGTAKANLTAPNTPDTYTYTATIYTHAEPSHVPTSGSCTVNVEKLSMVTPPENQTTQYTGETSGTGGNRIFYKNFVAGTNPQDNTLSVSIYVGSDYATAPSSGGGQYTTANWNITTLRSPKTAYATESGTKATNDATIHFKKNRQLITCAPDYIGAPYVSGANGPSQFDCSGFQYYLYNFVGVTVSDSTAQGFYNSSTHVTEGNLLPGDWIFFDFDSVPPSSSQIDHTGVYETTTGGMKVMIHTGNPTDDLERKVFTDYYENHSNGLYGHRYGANERF